MSQTVLVTGAAGLLGSACVAALLARGDRVVALVRDRRPASRLYQPLPGQWPLAERVIEVRADFGAAGRLLDQYTPDAVLHLGAQTQVPAAQRDPVGTFEANIRGTWQVLEACRRAARPPEAVLVASSDKAYGRAAPPYLEDTPLDPVGPYEVSKAAADWIARCYALRYDVPVVTTRCGNLYGPGDLNPERLIPHVCAALAADRPPLLRGTGAMSRAWLYVDDAADANLTLLDRAPELAGEAFNVAGREAATVRQIVDHLLVISGSSARPRYSGAEPEGEIQHQSLDSGRLYSLGWRAKVSLDEGLRRTFDWYRHLIPHQAEATL